MVASKIVGKEGQTAYSSASNVSEKAKTVSDNSFFLSRLHSLTGIFLALFLFEHLLTNSQAALWLGDDGIGFVEMVNWIHSLPYLKVIEVTLLAVPFAIHMWWGVIYLRQGSDSAKLSHAKMHKPRLLFARNFGYSWQRFTAWLLLFGVVGHILHMRILSHPLDLGTHQYGLRVEMDQGLYTLSARFNMQIYTLEKIQEELDTVAQKKEQAQVPSAEVNALVYDASLAQELAYEQSLQITREKLHRLASLLTTANPSTVILATPDFGTAALMLVREAFKSQTICWLYTFYVLAAVFHACNGLWTAGIVWGWTPSDRGQKISMLITRILMVKLAILGICAIWLTNFNLQS